MHPLSLLAAALGWNYCRHKRGLSTICSSTRGRIPRPVFVLGWVTLTAWLLPHWLHKNEGGTKC